MEKSLKLSLIGILVFVTLCFGIKQTSVYADGIVQQTITVYPDNGTADLYDNSGNKISGVEIAANTNLAVNEIKTINNVEYYRVAENRWIKTSDVYLYKMSLLKIKAKSKSYVNLVNAHGKEITNRGLSGDSVWKIDKVVEINGKKYYRVATNEFISAQNVSIIN